MSPCSAASHAPALQLAPTADTACAFPLPPPSRASAGGWSGMQHTCMELPPPQACWSAAGPPLHAACQTSYMPLGVGRVPAWTRRACKQARARLHACMQHSPCPPARPLPPPGTRPCQHPAHALPQPPARARARTGALVHVHLGLLAHDVGEAATDAADGGHRVHHLVLAVDCVVRAVLRGRAGEVGGVRGVRRRARWGWAGNGGVGRDPPFVLSRRRMCWNSWPAMRLPMVAAQGGEGEGGVQCWVAAACLRVCAHGGGAHAPSSSSSSSTWSSIGAASGAGTLHACLLLLLLRLLSHVVADARRSPSRPPTHTTPVAHTHMHHSPAWVSTHKHGELFAKGITLTSLPLSSHLLLNAGTHSTHSRHP